MSWPPSLVLLPVLLLPLSCGGEAGDVPGAGPGAAPESASLARFAGTYVLDRERFAEDTLAMTRDRVAETLSRMSPEEARAWERMRSEVVREDAEGTTLVLVLRPDGTFEAEGLFGAVEGRSPGVAKSARGTWRAEGETLLLRTTIEDGRRAPEPSVVRAAFRDGAILLGPEGTSPATLSQRISRYSSMESK